MWKCPECQHQIDSLNYRVDTQSSEYGSASLATRNHERGGDRIDGYDSDDYGDNEWVGSPDYTCPECDNEINLTDLIWTTTENDEDDEDEIIKPKPEPEPEETLHKIIRPEKDILKSNSPTNTGNCMKCKKCSHIFVIEETYRGGYNRNGEEDGDELFECPKCGISNNLSEYRKLFINNNF